MTHLRLTFLSIFILSAWVQAQSSGLYGNHSDDSVPEIQESTKNADAANAALMEMQAGIPAQARDNYSFENRIVLTMEAYNKKGKKEGTYKMTLLTNNESSNLGIQMNQEGVATDMVYDMESMEVITLMNTGGQKMGTTMKMNNALMNDSKGSVSGKTPQFKKTGKTEKIAGFECEEYILEDAEGTESASMSYWITTETEVDWVKAMAGIGKNNKSMPDVTGGLGYPKDGAIMRITAAEKGGESVTMTVTEIETGGDFSIKTDGYTFMNFGGQ